MRTAVIDRNGTVVNLVVLTADADYDPGEDRDLLALDDDSPVSIGWTWDRTTWTKPTTPPEPPMTTEAWLQRQINDLTDLILFG